MITDWHPLIIHFPIALISTSVAFECLHFILKRDDLLSASWWTMFFGLIASLAAVASGIIDDSLIGHFGAVWPLWQNHGAMQILTIALFGFVFYIKNSKPKLSEEYNRYFLLSEVLLVGVLFYGAHLGAVLSGRA